MAIQVKFGPDAFKPREYVEGQVLRLRAAGLVDGDYRVVDVAVPDEDDSGLPWVTLTVERA